MRRKLTKLGLEVQLALVCLLCLCVGVTLCHSNGSLNYPSAGKARSYPAALPFVIADLDGDQKPDLALVELGSQRSANTTYSIRLQLSAGADLAIGVNGPLGGLRVAARDVNGDDKVDLIVTSNLDADFLEVLLNDGHGNFSVAAPGAYPELENKSDAFLNAPAGPIADQTSLESLRSSFGEQGITGSDYYRPPSSDEFPLTKNQTALRQVVYARLGRSPPGTLSLA